MEAIWTAVAIGIAAAVLMAFRGRQRQRLSRKPTQWPPGPTRLPLIGNMHQILKGGDPFHVAINKLAQVYGPLMTVWFGTRQPTIIVSDHNLVWEVLVSKSADYAAREIPITLKPSLADFRTIVSSNAGPPLAQPPPWPPKWRYRPTLLSSRRPSRNRTWHRWINNMIKEANLNGGVVKPFPHIRRASLSSSPASASAAIFQ
ncbi:putative CYP719 [Cinnamomum micranthum f. kanehirae]|uniref:Putative CYP719 n=1 Tax=Cinnamomum micranthum f. kanehirae TaxID=337451 RepID=A0A3S3NDK6_9MAGN|nr:putative CYP719 [Cinnamomum micranthum f. kanehirae]